MNDHSRLRPSRNKSWLAPLLCLVVWGGSLPGQEFDEQYELWPENLKIGGTLLLCAGPATDPARQRFWRGLAGETPVVHLLWGEQQALEMPEREDASVPPVVAFRLDGDPAASQGPWLAAIEQAPAVWISGELPDTDEGTDRLAPLADAVERVLSRGGRVLIEGGLIEYAGRSRLRDQARELTLEPGGNWLPDAVIVCDWDGSDRAALDGCLAWQPHCVGIGMERGASIVVSGRQIQNLAEDDAVAEFRLAANERLPVKVKRLPASPARRADPYRYRLDWTAWRRQAIERQGPPFPPAEPEPPRLEKGTLFIVGGGGMPAGLMESFVERAGGAEARLVYIPCTESEEIAREPGMVQMWKKMGVASATWLHTKDRRRAHSDDEFLAPLADATGIWFGGGRQWNFVDSWYGTHGHRLMKEVLKRGGVIGGSSAGASVQGRYLARANPLANFDIMADGYERGLGFLDGVAIDQHFSQRNRLPDMSSLVDRYPQLLGIGIDETTALIVEGSVGRVVGEGKVFFYDRRQPVWPDRPDYTALSAGAQFDLVERKVIED